MNQVDHCEYAENNTRKDALTNVCAVQTLRQLIMKTKCSWLSYLGLRSLNDGSEVMGLT